MRELTKEEIDQVSAGPTPVPPVAAIPTIYDAAAGSAAARIGTGPGMPRPLALLAEGGHS